MPFLNVHAFDTNIINIEELAIFVKIKIPESYANDHDG